VHLLLEKGANATAEDYEGRVALHMAAERGHLALVQQLLEKGADVEAEAKAVVRLLLEWGVNPGSAGHKALPREPGVKEAGFGNALQPIKDASGVGLRPSTVRKGKVVESFYEE
jgi:hypothetical protein